MKCYMAENTKSSDFFSTNYIQLNNCGWYEDVNEGFATYRPDGRSDYQVIYVKKGKIRFKEQTIDGGYLYFFKPKTPQNYQPAESGTEFYWIHFTGEVAEILFNDLKKTYVKVGKMPEFEKFCREVISNDNKTVVKRVKNEGALLCLLSRIKDILSEKDVNSIDEAVAYINENYFKKISNQEYAEKCGLSKFYFIKKFKDKMGEPPQHYRIETALKKSKHLLLDTNMSITEIAETLGFEDSLYFSKMFKKYFECSPSNYRKKNKHNILT